MWRCTWRETNGLVDPTIGRCLIDLGYDRSFEHLDASRPVVVTAAHVRPGGASPSTVLATGQCPAGVRLDLGASAKPCARTGPLTGRFVTGCGSRQFGRRHRGGRFGPSRWMDHQGHRSRRYPA